MNLPQTPLELVSGQLGWAHTNINNNLDFIPEDKLDWKPAPEAKSVLEIINHAAGTVNMFTSSIKGGAKPELADATNREEAKALVTQVIEAHQSLLKTLGPNDMERILSLPVGDLPVAIAAALPVVELINHHGQLTYIQTLLGDPESHLIIQ
ncbi:hypothetical protein IAD21_01136 [Abditibacteriota bacterium]|nr:hypothetical protein IAD21_01136 [Abditibacteriota bacterium]